jgi:starch-binding outer membrane protein SusE/F
MKSIFKFVFLSLLLTTVVWSCSKDEKKIYYEGGTSPVLTSTKTTLVLTDATKLNDAVTFSWTNPNYRFTTGISSQNVNYILEIDTTGANFTSVNKQSLAISNYLNVTFSVGYFNSVLANQLLIKTGMPHNLDIRIKSTLVNNSVPLYSNVVKLTATPFMPPPKVTPPTAGTLWIVGNAVAGGWDNPPSAANTTLQKFTRVSETLYTITIPMIAGGGYKLIQTLGAWGSQYHAMDGSVVTGGDFELKDSDPQFPAPAASGTYKITIDFQYGKYYVVKV